MSKNTVLNTYNFVSTSNRQPQLDSNQYELIIRQQPKQARLCSSKERDRRPVDPPPIIQLKVNGYGDEAQNFLQSPYYFMCANLMHPTDNSESFTVSSRYLAGTVVSSLHKLKDIDNKDGGFFVFGDISVRVEGRYRLRFSLFEIVRDEVVHIQSVTSDVFTVYSPKTFPGMSESTFLSRSFSDQGVRIRIRKEHRIQMKRPQSNSRQSDNAECDDDNLNDDGIMETPFPIKRKRSRSQILQSSTSPTTEMFDNYSSPTPYPPPPSQPSSYVPPPHLPYSQQHQYSPRQRHGGGSLSYPPPLGFSNNAPHAPPQRQHSYYESSEYESSSRDDHTLSSPYYYNREQYEQSILNKRPRLSNSDMMPYDSYRQPSSTVPPLNNNQYTTNSHHYNNSPPPLPLPPPSSSTYRTPRRGNTLSPLLEHQPSYGTSSSNNANAYNRSPSLPPVRHHSFDILTSTTTNTTSLDSYHYSATTTTTPVTNLQPPQSHQPPQPIPPSESSYYRPPLLPPKTPVRSRTLPLYMNRNNDHSISNINNISNDDNSDNNLHYHNRHHHSTASSNQLPTPKTSIDVDGRYNNKKQLYTPYPPLTPPNLNKSSSVDSYKNGNDNSNSNLTPSFTQQFTLSPRPAPLQLSKSPLLSDNNVTRTSSLPVMSSNTSSSNITMFLNDRDEITSSPQLLPTNNDLPRLPPITALTDLIKKKEQEQQYYHPHDHRYNNNNAWHNNSGVNGNYES